MKRTQIYLDDHTYKYLKNESELKHLTVSEVIRKSIREKMERKTKNILMAADRISGIWKERKFDVESHIRKLRKDRKAW